MESPTLAAAMHACFDASLPPVRLPERDAPRLDAPLPDVVPGLVNVTGNSCFFNACMQALAPLPPFSHFCRHIVAVHDALIHVQRSVAAAEYAWTGGESSLPAGGKRAAGEEDVWTSCTAAAAAGGGSAHGADASAAGLARKLLDLVASLNWPVCTSSLSLFSSSAALLPSVQLDEVSSMFADRGQHDAHELFMHLMQVLDDDELVTLTRALSAASTRLQWASRLSSVNAAAAAARRAVPQHAPLSTTASGPLSCSPPPPDADAGSDSSAGSGSGSARGSSSDSLHLLPRSEGMTGSGSALSVLSAASPARAYGVGSCTVPYMLRTRSARIWAAAALRSSPRMPASDAASHSSCSGGVGSRSVSSVSCAPPAATSFRRRASSSNSHSGSCLLAGGVHSWSSALSSVAGIGLDDPNPCRGIVASRIVCEACKLPNIGAPTPVAPDLTDIGDPLAELHAALGRSSGRRTAAPQPRPILSIPPDFARRPPASMSAPPRPWIHDTFQHLSLSVPSSAFGSPGSVPLSRLLGRHFADDEVSGYMCDNDGCGHVNYEVVGRRAVIRETNARRQTCLIRCPPVLVLHIKRTEMMSIAGGEYMAADKSRVHVSFPQRLDMAPYTLNGPTAAPELHGAVGGSASSGGGSGGGSRYYLASMIEHLGGVAGGHYVTYRRVPVDWTLAASNPGVSCGWVRASDTQVRPVSLAHVHAQQAYLLMYVREDTAGPLGKAPPLPLMFGVERICASTSEVVQSVPPATWLRQSAAALVADMMSSFRPPAARSLKAAQWEATLRERTDAVVDAALALSVSMGGAAASGSAAVVATEADSLRMSEALLRHVRAWLLRKLHTQSSSIRIVTFPTSV